MHAVLISGSLHATRNLQVNEAAWGPTPDRITMAVDDGTVRIVAANRLEVPLWKLQSHLGGTNTFRYSAGQK